MRGLTRSRALLALLAISVGAWVAWAWLDIPSALAWARGLHGPVPALFLVPLQTAISLSLSPVPSDVVGIAICVVYGFTRGSLLVWMAWMLGAWIQYALVRRIANRVETDAKRSHLPSWMQRLPVEHPAFLICGRWVPLGPHLVNSAAGAAGIPLWRYTWTAAVGIAPVAILIGAIATGLLAAGASGTPGDSATASRPETKSYGAEGRRVHASKSRVKPKLSQAMSSSRASNSMFPNGPSILGKPESPTSRPSTTKGRAQPNSIRPWLGDSYSTSNPGEIPSGARSPSGTTSIDAATSARRNASNDPELATVPPSTTQTLSAPPSAIRSYGFTIPLLA